MHQILDTILVIKNKNFTCFFDPESLIVFAQKNEKMSDEKIVADYNKSKMLYPKIDVCNNNTGYQDFSSVYLDLHVTNDCNLRCKYCYIEESCKEEKKHREMSEEIIERGFRFALDTFSKAKSFHIVLYGGEPLLFWNKFHFLVAKARDIFRDKKITIGFPTNGTIISEEILAFLKANNINFQLSWDGSEEEQDFLRPMANGKGTSEIINKNLSRFKEISNTFVVRTTITPYNMNLSALFLFFKEKGFRKMAFCTCSSCQNDLIIKEEDLPKLFHEWDLLIDLYLDHLIRDTSLIQLHPIFPYLMALHYGGKKSHFCGSGKNLFAISIEGDIYSCHRFIGNKKYKIGDLCKGFYPENSLKRDLFSRNVEKEKDCEVCFAKYLCGGGCFHERSQAKFETFCQINTHLIAQTIHLYAELQVHHPEAFGRVIKKLEELKKEEYKGMFL